MPSVLANDVSYTHLSLKLLTPFLMCALTMIGFYGLFYFGVGEFQKVYEDFDTDLPALSQFCIEIGSCLRFLGPAGFIVFFTMISIACGIALALTRSSAIASFVSRVPIVGVSFRWAAQARVARALAALVRREAEYPEAVRVATKLTGFRNIAHAGDNIAYALEEGQPVSRLPQCVASLPFSILTGTTTGAEDDNADRRQTVCTTFDNLAAALNDAALGQGEFAVLVSKIVLVSSMGFAIGLVVIAMFLPLIKLLNDLA